MELYYRIFETCPDAFVLANPDGIIVKVNAAAEEMFGYPGEELVGKEIEVLMPERFSASHHDHRKEFGQRPRVRRMGTARLDLFARAKNGREFPVDIMIAPLESDAGMLILSTIRDISRLKDVTNELRKRTQELEQLHEQMRILATRDSLTGLLNRRAFEEHAEWLLVNAVRRHDPVSLLLIDLDFFKRINDQFGHAEGDRVLGAVAAVLQGNCRESDMPARYGGEEFVIALADTDKQGSLVVAENFRARIESISGLALPVTASIGVATFVPPIGHHVRPPDLADFVDSADQALYRAKNDGRNRVCHVLDMVPAAPIAD
ncbi:MAG TPA: sensor domain-containing diguanylate cyclase [Usitatibacteraceae bacterium]|nr:sensor domain-containing diguanylate cyclase [Usitatibacteraceae bacterium]